MLAPARDRPLSVAGEVTGRAVDERERREHLGSWVRGAVHTAILGADRLGRLTADLAVRAIEAWRHGGDEFAASLFSCRGSTRWAARRYLLRHDPATPHGKTPRERREAMDAQIERVGMCRDMKPLDARRYLAHVLGIAVETNDDLAGKVLALLALSCLARIEDRIDPDRRPPTVEEVEFSAAFPWLGAFRPQGAMAELNRLVERVDDPAPAAAVARAVLDGDAEEDDAAFVRRVRALVTPRALAALAAPTRRPGRPLKPRSQVERVTAFIERSGRTWTPKQLEMQAEFKDIRSMRAVLAAATARHPPRVVPLEDADGDRVYGVPPSAPPPDSPASVR